MEQENAVVEGQVTTDQEQVQEPETVSREEFQQALETINQLKSTNERILNESKGYKSKYMTLKDELSVKEKEQLEASGDLQTLLEKERNERFELEKRWKQEKETRVAQDLKFQVARLASDAYDVEDVITSLKGDMVSYDEDTQSFSGLQEAIESVRESKKYLFKTDAGTKMVSQVPHGKMITAKPKTVSEMTRAERRDGLSSALAGIIRK